MDKNFRYWVITALFLILAFIVGIYVYCAMIDGVYVNLPIEFHYWYGHKTVTHQTVKACYRRGEVVDAHIIAYKQRTWPAVIQWTFVDGVHQNYPPKWGVLEKGRNERIVKVEQVPLKATGEGYFTGVAVFDLNFIRKKIYIPIQTNRFTIVENEKEKK